MLSTRESIIMVLWITLALLIVFIIVYRFLLKRFKRGRIEKELYFVMHPIEKSPASGTVQIFIEMHNIKEVEISIFSMDRTFHKVISKENCKKGGNIIQLDTTLYQNGFYFYQAETENQKARKRIEIRN